MMGLKDAQIVKHGLPIRPAFSKAIAKREPLRRRLGLNATLPAVLMVGGGEGMGQLEATVREIADKGTRCQVRSAFSWGFLFLFLFSRCTHGAQRGTDPLVVSRGALAAVRRAVRAAAPLPQ